MVTVGQGLETIPGHSKLKDWGTHEAGLCDIARLVSSAAEPIKRAPSRGIRSLSFVDGALQAVDSRCRVLQYVGYLLCT